MKKINFINKIAAVLFITFSLSNTLHAQYIKNRWNIKIGYTQYETGAFNGDKAEKTGQFLLETNYGLLNFLETGLYFGLGNFMVYATGDNPIIVTGYEVLTPFYGINTNIHILPFFIDADDFRLDAYFTGKFGVQYFNTEPNYYHHGNEIEYGVGGGLSFYPWKHLGVYVEYSYGKYFFSEDKDLFRYGISYKF